MRCCKQRFKSALELVRCVRFAHELRSVNELRLQLVSRRIAGRLQHTQIGTHLLGFARQVTAAKHVRFEINIREQEVDPLG